MKPVSLADSFVTSLAAAVEFESKRNRAMSKTRKQMDD